MKAPKSLLSAAGIVASALAALPLTYGADVTDRTSMPDACAERDVNCVLPDGGAGPRRAQGGTSSTQTPTPGDNTVIVTPSAGFGATPSVQAVPALPGQVPSLGNTNPTLPNPVTSAPGAAGTAGASGSGAASASGQASGATGSTSGSSGFRGSAR